MAAPKEFTLDAVRLFIIDRGGKVTNHELVKHFKQFLTDPLTKGSRFFKNIFLFRKIIVCEVTVYLAGEGHVYVYVWACL